MNNSLDSLLEIANHIITKHPLLAPKIEAIAAHTQGKGFSAESMVYENEIVHQLLKKQPLIAIDIGANIGDYSAELRRRNANLEIHVFEPASTNVEKLTQRFAGDKLIKINPLAVSNKNSSATLFSDSPGSALGSLNKRKLEHHNIDLNLEETVVTICFEDYWIKNLGKRVLDIVKIDIEGYELNALKGFREAIHYTNLIQFEFGGTQIDTRTYFRDFWYFFKENNFDIFRITPSGYDVINAYNESDECFLMTNYIAINQNLN
jgi:FkbM family methyltransferase